LVIVNRRPTKDFSCFGLLNSPEELAEILKQPIGTNKKGQPLRRRVGHHPKLGAGTSHLERLAAATGTLDVRVIEFKA
jgi:hypothetical protein